MKSSFATEVMLVDDDRELVAVIEQVGSLIGMSVTSFGRGQDAIDRFSEVQPKVVLIDLGLHGFGVPKGLGGLEVGRQIRDLPGGDSVVLVLISGVVPEPVRAMAEEIGFAKVIEKPFDLPPLIELLKKSQASQG